MNNGETNIEKMEKSQYQKMYELEDSHWWFLAKRQFIKTLLPAPPKNWQILDLGCGTGGITVFLQSWGKATGIESSPHAQKYLRQRDVKFFSSAIETFKNRKESYDLVCLFDVLYHREILNDEKVLKIAYEALKKDGLLLITDSALPFLFSRHDEIMHARERYSLADLVQKVENAGFKIEKRSYTYFFLFPLFVISRLINEAPWAYAHGIFKFFGERNPPKHYPSTRLRSLRVSAESHSSTSLRLWFSTKADKYLNYSTVTPVNPTINSFFLSICRLEALLLKYICFPFGSSIIIKARKP